MKVGHKRYVDIYSSTLIHPEDLARDVGMQEWRVSSERLLTVAASTCIVMAAHNAVSKKGLIGHFTSISETDLSRPYNHQRFDEAVVALDGLGVLAFTKIWLGGGRPFLENGVDTVKPDRQYAEQHVVEHLASGGLNSDLVVVTWSQPDRLVDVELDSAEGILWVHDYPDASLLLASGLGLPRQ